MLFALGAASSALDALQSLTTKKATPTPATTGLTQNTTTAFDPSNILSDSPSSSTPSSGSSSQSGRLSPDTMSALLAAQGQSDTPASSAPTSASDALQDLFSQLDGNGDGQISKSEFEDKLGAGGTNVANADAVFDKLDKDGDGSVSQDELTSALKNAGGGKGHHHHHVASSDSSSSTGTSADGATDPLLQALDGASSTSTTNSDGSVTTSMTYADGSKVSMTSAASGSSSTATSTYNVIEQMIQKQAQAISSQAASSLSVSV